MEEEELNRQLLDVGGTVADELPPVPSAEPSRPEPRVGQCQANLLLFLLDKQADQLKKKEKQKGQ